MHHWSLESSPRRCLLLHDPITWDTITFKLELRLPNQLNLLLVCNPLFLFHYKVPFIQYFLLYVYIKLTSIIDNKTLLCVCTSYGLYRVENLDNLSTVAYVIYVTIWPISSDNQIWQQSIVPCRYYVLENLGLMNEY